MINLKNVNTYLSSRNELFFHSVSRVNEMIINREREREVSDDVTMAGRPINSVRFIRHWPYLNRHRG